MDREITIRLITAKLPDGIRGTCTVEEKTGKYLMIINENQGVYEQGKSAAHEFLHIFHDDHHKWIDPAIESVRHRQCAEMESWVNQTDQE